MNSTHVDLVRDLSSYFHGSWGLFALTLLFVTLFFMSSGRDLYRLIKHRRAERRWRRELIEERMQEITEIKPIDLL